MNLAVLSGFVVLVAVSLLIGYWRRHDFGTRNVFPVLVFAFLALALAPLHAQERAAVHKVAPVFPPIAKQMGITGTVVVNVTIDPTGKVIKAESASNSKLFVSAAIDAVKQWKFAPGESTDTVPITINFEKN